MTSSHQKVSGRVGHMLEAVQNAKADIGFLSKEQFLSDGKTQRAVIESLVVMGEAANKILLLDPTLQQHYPSIWQQLRDVYDMRIVLTHEYFRVDPSIVWNTVQNDLPEIEQSLRDFITQYVQK